MIQFMHRIRIALNSVNYVNILCMTTHKTSYQRLSGLFLSSLACLRRTKSEILVLSKYFVAKILMLKFTIIVQKSSSVGIQLYGFVGCGNTSIQPHQIKIFIELEMKKVNRRMFLFKGILKNRWFFGLKLL